MVRLRVTEIFASLQGESTSSGIPTLFIRLTGCPLRCSYCDTDYAFSGGQWMELGQILAETAAAGCRYVTVTGGEPLAQEGCKALLGALCDAGYRVSLETSGALDVAPVDPRVIRVLDLKTPGSGEQDRNLWSNLDHLRPSDEIKFVLCDEADYRWAVAKLGEYHLPGRCELLFSAAQGRLEPRALADWVLRDRLPVRFQLQLHKLLWGAERGR
jgi:7-carboxy-7-deazaguanine synthase